MIIQCNALLYTRAKFLDDYHWVYKSSYLNENEINEINGDYSSFAENRAYRVQFLNNNYLFVRKVSNGLCFYRFYDTQLTDVGGRPIYALYGYSFHGAAASKIHDILREVSIFMFYSLSGYEWKKSYKSNTNKILEIDTFNIKNFISSNNFQEINELITEFLFSDSNVKGFKIYKQEEKLCISKL